jgi:hypothetical protein
LSSHWRRSLGREDAPVTALIIDNIIEEVIKIIKDVIDIIIKLSNNNELIGSWLVWE